jgi:hypothetical protein
VVDDSPAAFALIGRRGEECWVGGMGTAPAHLHNAPADERFSHALERLGANVRARQHEMRLRLA